MGAVFLFLLVRGAAGEQLEILARVEPFPSRVLIAADKNNSNASKHDKLMIRLTLERLLIVHMAFTFLSSI